MGIESLADAGSTLFLRHPDARIGGTVDTVAAPYLRLTGTSMAAPVVAGIVALMLEANPALTPNLVKAVLQYTAERKAGYEPTAQGGGFVNARGAVQLAFELAGLPASEPDPTPWSRQFQWGNERALGGTLTASASAWRAAVVWGAPVTATGDAVTWGLQDDGVTPWTASARPRAGRDAGGDR